jgi:hypothetical protein
LLPSVCLSMCWLLLNVNRDDGQPTLKSRRPLFLHYAIRRNRFHFARILLAIGWLTLRFPFPPPFRRC